MGDNRRVVFHARLDEKSAQLKGPDSRPNVSRGLGNAIDSNFVQIDVTFIIVWTYL